MMRALASTVGAVLVSALAVAGCSSSSGDKSSTSSPPKLTSSSKAGFPSTPASTPAPNESETITAGDIAKVLLVGSDISETATATPQAPTDNPLPCAPAGSLSLNHQVPATARAGVNILIQKSRAALSEEYRVFPDISTAVHAQSVVKDGLSCSKGLLHTDSGANLAITLSGPDDITSQLKQDTKLAEVPIGSAFTFFGKSSDGAQYVLAAAQIDHTLLLMTFVAASIADESSLPDPVSVLQKAIEKAS